MKAMFKVPHVGHLCVSYSVCRRDGMTLKGGIALLLLAGVTAGGSLHCPACLWLSQSPVVSSLGH